MAAMFSGGGLSKSDKRPKQVSILKPVLPISGLERLDDEWDISPLVEGARFNSYEALSRSIDLYCKQQGIKLFRSDSRTLRSAPNRANPIIPQLAPEQLVYYSLTYSCVYGGKSFRNFSKSKQPCKFFVRVNITKDYQQLEVSKICDPGVHNHDNQGLPATPSSKVSAPRKRHSCSHISRPVKQGKQGPKPVGESVDTPGAEHICNIFNTLHCYQKKGLFCDTLVITKSGMVYAHSVVLAAVSPMLYSALNQQPFSNRQPNVIDLSDCSSVLVSQVLDFFYSGQVFMPNAIYIKQICARLGVVLESDENESGLFPGEDPPEKENVKDKEGNDTSNNEEKQDVASVEKKISSKSKISLGVSKKSKNKVEKIQQKKLSKLEQALLKANVAEGSKTESGQTRVKRKYKKAEAKKTSKAVVLDLTVADESESQSIATDTQSSQQSLQASSVNSHALDGEVSESASALKNESVLQGRRESASQFRGFLKSLTQQPQYPCKQCCRVFKRETSLNTHMWKHWRNADRAGFTCTTCDAVVATRRDLRKHSFEAHAQPLIAPHQCTVCGAKFLYRTRLWRHMTRHIDSTVYVCDTCDRWHNVRDFSEEHSATHRSQHWWTCGTCGKRCISHVERIRHKLWAHRRGTCRSVTTELDTLNDSTDTEHRMSSDTSDQLENETGRRHAARLSIGCGSNRGRRYVCRTCGIKFDQLSAAAGHLKQHAGSNEVRGDETAGSGNETEGRGDKTEGCGDKTEGCGDKTKVHGDVTRGRGDVTQGCRNETEVRGNITEGRTDVSERRGNETEGRGNVSEECGYETEGKQCEAMVPSNEHKDDKPEKTDLMQDRKIDGNGVIEDMQAASDKVDSKDCIDKQEDRSLLTGAVETCDSSGEMTCSDKDVVPERETQEETEEVEERVDREVTDSSQAHSRHSMMESETPDNLKESDNSTDNMLNIHSGAAMDISE